MIEHLLLKLATRKPYMQSPAYPANAEYDGELGYWTLDGQPLVFSPEFLNGPQVSKKCDQETGEDIKGE